MNFARSVIISPGLAIRFLRPHGCKISARFRSVSMRESTKSVINNVPKRNQCTSILQRLVHSSAKNQNSLRSNGALVVKKRPLRKKRAEEPADGRFNVYAYATAEEYDLESLHTALTKQDLYETKKFYTEGEDVLHVRSKINIEPEPRDIFFFREGSVVLWNCSEPETKTILRNLKQFEISPYNEAVIKAEKEVMSYAYVEDHLGSLRNETFYIQSNEDGDLDKYTFSNAMTSSVKLGIWEATLDSYIEGLTSVTSDLKEGRRIRMSRANVLQKTGELFALKHLINLDSDLLGTPDFYWDRKELEQLFNKTSAYFSISKRKRVINEKISHCIELTDLVSSNLNDIHHVRLEWMIIILIMVEVAFETIHYIDRYVASSTEE